MTPVNGSQRIYDLVMPITCASASQCEEVMWFTDRPERDSDSISIEDFSGLWDMKGKNSFRSGPPNIAIVTQNEGVLNSLFAVYP